MWRLISIWVLFLMQHFTPDNFVQYIMIYWLYFIFLILSISALLYKDLLCRYQCFFVISLNELLNKFSRCRWFKTPWRSYDATAMVGLNTTGAFSFTLFSFAEVHRYSSLWKCVRQNNPQWDVISMSVCDKSDHYHDYGVNNMTSWGRIHGGNNHVKMNSHTP